MLSRASSLDAINQFSQSILELSEKYNPEVQENLKLSIKDLQNCIQQIVDDDKISSYVQYKEIKSFFQIAELAYQRLIYVQEIKTEQDKLKKSNEEVEQLHNRVEQLLRQSEYSLTSIKEQQQEVGNLKDKIEGLTLDTIKLALAQRYTTEKTANKFTVRLWTIYVMLGLAALGGLPYIPISLNMTSSSLSDYAVNTLTFFPLYLPCIWFILFASRRRNEANRLASDYAHKEVFAASYLAYQEEIEQLKESNKNNSDMQAKLTELNIKLLDAMIGVLSDNPAKSLDIKKSTDELPIKEFINLASETIKASNQTKNNSEK